MKKVEFYMADDGSLFLSERECLEYEDTVCQDEDAKILQAINEFKKNIASTYDSCRFSPAATRQQASMELFAFLLSAFRESFSKGEDLIQQMKSLPDGHKMMSEYDLNVLYKAAGYPYVEVNGQMKRYFEFCGSRDLNKHLIYWSNCCGDLHHNGEYDLKNASELPTALQRAFKDLWEEGNGCLEYLVEYDGKYYVALSSEFNEDFADNNDMLMDGLYQELKDRALKLYSEKLFAGTTLVLRKADGSGDYHEVIFLVPASASKNIYDAIESRIYDGLWED